VIDRGEIFQDGHDAGAVRMSVTELVRSGALAGVIKLASAGLSFVMFVAVAMVTDEREFGLFSAAYSGASLVSFFASVGQQSTVLRFWPQYVGANDLDSAHGLMARAIWVALAGLAVSSLLVLVIGFVPIYADSTPEWLPLCAATALLVFALGWSEFASGAFRAKNELVSALLPRDVVWRAVTIAVAGAAALAHVATTAVTATLITGAVLVLCTVPQTVILLRDTFYAKRGPLSQRQKDEFASVTLGLWGVTSLPPALGQVSVLLVAAILGPEAAGAIFVADRTTRLILLALTGINQVLAPQISSAFYSGDRAHVQRITSLAAGGGFAIAIATLIMFWIFGEFILSIFDPAYATPTMHLTLVIFALGATVGTACGPVELLMQLTGMQHVLFKLLIVVNVVGLAVTAVTTYLWGPIGAALSIAGTVVTWNILAVRMSQQRIGINPSLVGLLVDRHLLGAGMFERGRT
jgi:O-antigen/teichoic acid export membrane protein